MVVLARSCSACVGHGSVRCARARTSAAFDRVPRRVEYAPCGPNARWLCARVDTTRLLQKAPRNRDALRQRTQVCQQPGIVFSLHLPAPRPLDVDLADAVAAAQAHALVTVPVRCVRARMLLAFDLVPPFMLLLLRGEESESKRKRACRKDRGIACTPS